MKRIKSLFWIGTITLLSLAGCNKEQPKAHVHAYDLEHPDWAWIELASGGYSASVTLECSSCKEEKEGHFLELDAEVTHQQTVDPTCVSAGTVVYTAIATYQETELRDTKTVQIQDANAHNWVETVDPAYLKTAATCEEDAVYYKSCEHCHEVSNETFTVANTRLGHTLQHHARVGATCEVEGTEEHWECTRCHKLFADENGVTEVTAQSLVIATAHKWIATVSPSYMKSAPTCTEDGVYYYHCEYCDRPHQTETFVDAGSALGHDMLHHAAAQSTCQTQGNIEYWECQRCHGYYRDEQGAWALSLAQTKLPLAAHDMTHHTGTPAGCESSGTLDYWTCANEPGVYYKDAEGTETFDTLEDTEVEALGHEFNGSLVCNRNDSHSFKDLNGLADPAPIDNCPEVTASDLGIAENSVIPENSTQTHIFGDYDFNANKGADIWIDFSYTVPGGDTYFFVYLFNAKNDDGIILRVQTTRDNGIMETYLYSINDFGYGQAGSQTTIVGNNGAGQAGTHFFFPRSSGVKPTTTNLLHIQTWCVDESINLYRIVYSMGIEGGQQWYLNSNAEATENVLASFDVELGANYFADGKHHYVRFTSTNANMVTLRSAAIPANDTVAYRDINGDVRCVGHGQAILPNLVEEGYTFMGWFDANGNRCQDGESFTRKTVLTPRFIQSTVKMVTLDDFGYGIGNGSRSVTGDNYAAPQGFWTEGANVVDAYFIYQFEENTAADNYIIFGFPFDEIDALSRVYFRLNEDLESSRVKGYFYGASLGNAGSNGTYFSSDSGVRPSHKQPLLIHFQLTLVGESQIDFSVDLLNLVTGATYSISRTGITFDVGYNFSAMYVNRNRFNYESAGVNAKLYNAF